MVLINRKKLTVIFYLFFYGLLITFKEITNCCFSWFSPCGITWDCGKIFFFVIWEINLVFINFSEIKKELLDNYGYFLTPFSYRDVTDAVFILSGKLLHCNKALFFSIRVSFRNFICSLRTKRGIFINTNWKLSFKLYVTFSILSSNIGLKNWRIFFPNISLSLTVPFVCVSYTSTFSDLLLY